MYVEPVANLSSFHPLFNNQIIEISPDPVQPGRFTMWIMIDPANPALAPTVQTVSLLVPRRFYVNLRTPKPSDRGPLYRKVAGVSHGVTNDAANSTSGAGGRLLPRSHTLFHLYEYTVPEDVYALHATDIAADLARPDVEGVYELNIPPLFRTLMRLGCLCKVDRDALKSSFPGASLEESVFHLDQLRFCSLAQHPYLSTKAFRHVFLYHFQQPSPGPVPPGRRDAVRQLYLLVVPWIACGYVCVIDSARVNQLPDLATLYTRQRTKLLSDSQSMDIADFPPESLTFEVRVETDLAAGRRIVQRWLTAVRQGKRTENVGTSTGPSVSTAAPVLVLLHASVSNVPTVPSTVVEANEVGWSLGETITARRRAPQLTALAGFPVVPLAGTMDESDSQAGRETDPSTDAYSLLNWQQNAVKRGIRFFIQSEARFERQLELARYLHVPVANLPVSEAPASISLGTAEELALTASPVAAIELGCDLFYARHLNRQNHILWCSPTGCPDLGGKETDDQRLLLEMEEAGVVEVNHPGSYPHVTVELELSNLAVNTLLVANRIPELEGATSLTFDRLSATERPIEEQINQGLNLGANITSYDETAACSSAFRVLRNMVVGWVRDVTQYQNPLADELIIYFYQWLRSPRALLYDPALRRTVQKLMKKVFLKLVDELTHLNVDVVFANFSRFIVATRRLELSEALARVEHFTHLLRTRPGTLFTHLDLQYVASWRQLLWLDPANYAGIKALVDNLVDGKDIEWGEGEPLEKLSDTNDDDASELESENRSSQLPEPEVDMHWHIARYLPETRGLRGKFETLLAGYLLAVYNAVRKEHRRLRGLTVPIQRTNGIGTESRRFGTEMVGGNQDVDTIQSQNNDTFTAPLQSDASVSPGVLEFTEKLLRDQLAHELYTLVQRLHRKAGWTDPGLTSSTSSSLLNSNGSVSSNQLRERYAHCSMVVSAYLAEKAIRPQVDATDLDRRLDTADVLLPLLPPHPSSESLVFTPLLDFVKSICEILSLDRSLKRQVSGIRRDLLRLIGVGEFSPEAVWIAPHLARDQPLYSRTAHDSDCSSASPIRSLLVYLPEVACPTCNFTRDIDVCRDTYLVRLVDTADSTLGYWSWVCPHCQNVYPRARLEEALVQQLEQIALQHCLQDLQCTKCVSTGGIQETLLSKGGSVAQCADCSHRLSLTVPVGKAFYRRLDVYRAVGTHFGFPVLEQTAFWMLHESHLT